LAPCGRLRLAGAEIREGMALLCAIRRQTFSLSLALIMLSLALIMSIVT
jgi:hypothetical protein